MVAKEYVTIAEFSVTVDAPYNTIRKLVAENIIKKSANKKIDLNKYKEKFPAIYKKRFKKEFIPGRNKLITVADNFKKKNVSQTNAKKIKSIVKKIQDNFDSVEFNIDDIKKRPKVTEAIYKSCKEYLSAKRIAVEVQEKQRKLLPVADVRLAVKAVLNLTVQKFRNLPKRLSIELSGIDKEEYEEIIEKEVEDCLKSINKFDIEKL